MQDLFSCSMQNRLGIEPRPPALGAQSLSYWTPREVPRAEFLTMDLERFSFVCGGEGLVMEENMEEGAFLPTGAQIHP